jgi:hypothetical protein
LAQLCDEVHIYGYGNGACPNHCYHYYDCGATAGAAGVAQRNMFGNDPRATGGYHNFSAQARVLRRLASSGAIHAHWGSCEPTLGDPPATSLNHKVAARPARANRARRRTRVRKVAQ